MEKGLIKQVEAHISQMIYTRMIGDAPEDEEKKEEGGVVQDKKSKVKKDKHRIVLDFITLVEAVHPAVAARGVHAGEEALGLAEEMGELWLPRPGDREGALFHPGYGLLPDTERARQTRISCTGEGDRFHEMMFVLRTMKSLIERRTRTTKRDIFYKNFRVFQPG
jgi:hypothetical protein